MATHKRSRTGCWTCREAGYKCNEEKPFCGRCVRLNIICKGYGVKLKWQDDAVFTQTRPPQKTKRNRTDREAGPAFSPDSAVSSTSDSLTVSSSEAVRQSPESTRSIPLARSPGLSYGLSSADRWLLQYWVDQLSSLISFSPRNNQGTPFQYHLTSMAYESSALRSTILSMAAIHLASTSNDPLLHVQAYRHQRDAIRELQSMLQVLDMASTEPALATIMMMQVSARLFSADDEANVANHLLGAKAMIARYRMDGRSASSSIRFLFSLFAYHDILSSISRGSRPFVNHDADFTAAEGEKNFENIADILLRVSRTSELQDVIRQRRLGSADWIMADSTLTEEEDATGKALQQELLAMEFDYPKVDVTSNDSDVQLTTEAYRHAAFIYLYRTWLNIGAPNPISLDHVKRCLDCIARIDTGSPLSSAHVWPLFTAGCEAVDPAQREFVRIRFRDMYTCKRFPSLKRVLRDVEDVWVAKDLEQQMGGQDGMAKVDCIQVILNKRGREVDLA